ncbi:winged-helix domain-containing protein [Streptomyces sp. TG1A-60]|uniref:winged-helix domain-containing protein n=1 Tax=Streptomyces sp. TG1A-60 TaxID=3129111 RepID=UPI0030CD0AC4
MCRVGYREDAEAGHPDAAAWQQALEEATGGTPGAAGQLLIPHHGPDTGTDDLPADYQKIMEIVAGGDSPLQAKDVARELGLDAVPAMAEPVRGKLRKLAERGWITRTPAGRYLPR